jgi:hypothetical protein
MDRLMRIQRISAACRYVLLCAATALGAATMLALFTPEQNWISIGEGQFFAAWDSDEANRPLLGAIMAPVAITLILGVYWLQRLFNEYQQGHFFTDGSMLCYLWLVWLKAFSFAYALIWPLLLQMPDSGSTDMGITLDAGSVVELVVLLLIVNLLREAQQINEDNKGFV